MEVKNINGGRQRATALQKRYKPRRFGRRRRASTWADVLRSLSTPAVSLRETLDCVALYFGARDGTPIWSRARVQGVPGKETARRWSRYLRRRRRRASRGRPTGAACRIVVQTPFGFAATRYRAAAASRSAAPCVFDESPRLLSRPAFVIPAVQRVVSAGAGLSAGMREVP